MTTVEKTSPLQEAIETVEALTVEDQLLLIEIISKRLIERERQKLINDVAEARRNYKEGNVHRRSVADLMAELTSESEENEPC